MKALLSSTYFGPIQWYQKLNRYDECLIERHESFIKQTYRNRMLIPTTNGPLSLTIPTNHNTSLAMKDNMEITEKMIELLDIRPKISVTSEYIQNEELKVKSIESEELKVKSEEFNDLANHKVQSSNHKVQSKEVQSIVDFREAIRPKKPLPDAEFESKRYYQVYEQKFGFQPNMSILDLLFNEGNEAIFYL